MGGPHTYTYNNKDIYLGHHTHGRYKNFWHIKKGYVPGYMYWDKLGYSGWSEAKSKYDPTYPMTIEEISEIENICTKYIDNNESKILQPENANVPDHPYVLVLGQRPHDMVAQHAYIDTVQLSRMVVQAFKNSDLRVYTKPHPMSKATKYHGIKIEGSVHKLIAGARYIYTVNSGSGFEALMHGKTVYTSGESDYTPVTITVKSLEEIVETAYSNIPNYKIIHYLRYCFKEHFVNAYNKESIKKKILRCVEEYEI